MYCILYCFRLSWQAKSVTNITIRRRAASREPALAGLVQNCRQWKHSVDQILSTMSASDILIQHINICI